MKDFVLIGAAGYVAPRHMKAIKDTGNRLVSAYDPFDSVGIIDSYFPDADFFTEFERLDRHVDKLRREGRPVDYVSVCSPNSLHDSHIRFGLRIGAGVICEKPLVLNPWTVDALADIEREYQGTVNTILQLRLHPSVIALREKVLANPTKRYQVQLDYITARGKWYQYSWKGDVSRSGGVASNIGIHFFDMLLWVFGGVDHSTVRYHEPTRAAGELSLQRADVSWCLSIDAQDLPEAVRQSGGRTYRATQIDGEEFEFSGGFNELHTTSYQEILAGNGFGIADARPSIELAYSIRANS